MPNPIVVVPPPTPNSNLCRLCGYNRNSRLCCMADRGGKCTDPIHPIFEPVVLFLDDTKVAAFGWENYHLALELIAACRQEYLADYASGKHSNGFDFRRVDADQKRLVQRAKGKLFACGRVLAERAAAKKNKGSSRSLSVEDVLSRCLAKHPPVAQ